MLKPSLIELHSSTHSNGANVSTRQRNDGERPIFVLDTNVLLFDPKSLDVFDEHELVIPITVIEEVDRFKKTLMKPVGTPEFSPEKLML